MNDEEIKQWKLALQHQLNQYMKEQQTNVANYLANQYTNRQQLQSAAINSLSYSPTHLPCPSTSTNCSGASAVTMGSGVVCGHCGRIQSIQEYTKEAHLSPDGQICSGDRYYCCYDCYHNQRSTLIINSLPQLINPEYYAIQDGARIINTIKK